MRPQHRYEFSAYKWRFIFHDRTMRLICIKEQRPIIGENPYLLYNGTEHKIFGLVVG